MKGRRVTSRPRPGPPTAPSAAQHNRVLEAAERRALDLEDRLTEILTPLLERAGEIAAANFEARARRHPGAARIRQAFPLLASAPAASSTMVAVKPTPAQAEALAEPGGDPPEDLHVTLAYLGETEGDLSEIADALAGVPGMHAPLEGVVGGVGSFADNGSGHPAILLPSVPGLLELRHHVTQALAAAGIDYSRGYGFVPHLTLAYRQDGPQPPSIDRAGSPLDFGDLWVARGDRETIQLPLTGVAPVTASADHDLLEAIAEVARRYEPDPPDYGSAWWSEAEATVYWACADWTTNDEIDAATEAWLEIPEVEQVDVCGECPAPKGGDWVLAYARGSAGAESLEAASPPLQPPYCLPADLRTKTDPVRTAVAQTIMQAGVEGAGLSFDITNPLAGKVLAQSGSQIVGIAKTTQLDVMKTIRYAHEQGLSIPDTAKAIRAAMAESAPWRARLIARTELAAAVNGASLAATQIVAAASQGDPGFGGYTKVWMTAPGARYPRHEDYDGLDGQEAALDQPFDVGGYDLMFPGDPDGPPSEVCNCVPGDTLVETPGLRAAMRRWHEGDLIRVRLASGDELAATPNHPVLRADGLWIPIREVNEGDHLVSARPIRDAAGAPDPDAPPTKISEVYRAARVAAHAERISTTPADLHGDATYGEVEVVPVDGALLVDDEAATDEEVEQFGLTLAYAARAGACDRGAAARDVRGPRPYPPLEPAGLVGGRGERAALGVAQSRHPDPVRLGAVAHLEPHLAQPPLDRGAADAESSRDREDGVAAVVSLAEVIEIQIEPFHGWVYNLDTGDGWYTAGILAARNCRCTIRYSDGGPGPAPVQAGGHLECLHLAEAPVEAIVAAGGGPADWVSPAPEEILSTECEAPRLPGASSANVPAATTPSPSISGDAISVGAGPPLPAEMVAQIQRLGLDRWPPVQGEASLRLLRGAKDTEELYYNKATDTWENERASLHRRILDQHFAGKTPPPPGADRHAYFTAGGGASGKSGLRFDLGDQKVSTDDLAERPDTIYVDPDRIKTMIPEFGEIVDSGDVYAASAVHEESSWVAKRIVSEARARGYNVVLDTTGSSDGFLDKIAAFKEAGYETHVSMVSVPTNTAIKRAMLRGDKSGRYVAIRALKSAHAGASAQAARWTVSRDVDRWTIYDNSGPKPIVVAEGRGGEITAVYDQAALDALLAKQAEAAVS